MIPEKAAMLYLLCSLSQGAAHFSRSFWATPFILGFCVTSVMDLVFIRKKYVFFSGVILVCGTGGQKIRYGLPQLPSVEQYLWVDSKPVHVSKIKVWLVCVEVTLRAS